MSTLETTQRQVFHLNDLDHPPVPLDLPDYRDLMVIDQEGQQIGRVLDTIFDMQTHKPLVCMVSYGGFMDMGARHILVPYEWFYDPTHSTVRARITRWQASQAPPFDPKDHNDVDAYYQYWFAQAAPAEASPALRPVPQVSADSRGPLVRVSRAPDWERPEDVQDLRGREVVDANNNRLGQVDDWFYSMSAKQPEIVVIRHGGLFGFLSDEWMVPYSRVESLDGDRLRLNATEEELRNAPQFQKDEVLDFSPFYEYWHSGNPAEVTFNSDTGQVVSTDRPANELQS